MTATQTRAYIIADNKLALNAGWDEELRGLGKSEMLWNPNIVVSVMYRCLHQWGGGALIIAAPLLPVTI